MPLPPPRISKSRRPSPSPISSDMPTANGDHFMAELHPSSPSPTASDMPMANGNHFMAELPAPVNKDVDFAKYFCTYAYLYYQKVMLSDRVRMEAYYNAVFKNPYHFRNKVLSNSNRKPFPFCCLFRSIYIFDLVMCCGWKGCFGRWYWDWNSCNIVCSSWSEEGLCCWSYEDVGPCPWPC